MEQVEVFVRLKFPDSVADSQCWETLLQKYLAEYGQEIKPSLFMDEEQEVMTVSFGYERLMNLNMIMAAIARTGAVIIEQAFKFPIFYYCPDIVVNYHDHSKFCTSLESISGLTMTAITKEKLVIGFSTSEPDELLSLVREAILKYNEQSQDTTFRKA